MPGTSPEIKLSEKWVMSQALMYNDDIYPSPPLMFYLIFINPNLDWDFQSVYTCTISGDLPN